MLLSRAAEQIFWFGRHLERVEGLSRIVREHTDLIVDLPIDVYSDWSALLAITGAAETFDTVHPARDETNIVHFLLSDAANPGSLRSSIEAARENLRVSRTSFPVIVWNDLNELRIDSQPTFDQCHWRGVRVDLCDGVIKTCQRIGGVIAGSMSRGQATHFFELGRLIERADLATRVLDVRATTLLASADLSRPPADRSPYEDVRWLGVLRSLNAQEMYRRASTVTVNGARVTDFVLDDRRFPRSVGFCVDGIGEVLAVLPEQEEVDLAHGRLERLLGNRPSGQVDPLALHDFLDEMQMALGDVHASISAAYFHPEPVHVTASS